MIQRIKGRVSQIVRIRPLIYTLCYMDFEKTGKTRYNKE